MVRKTADSTNGTKPHLKGKSHWVDLTRAVARVNEHQALIELEQETQLPLRKMLETILVEACA